MLTANDMETDVVAGLELGADDYITKPFSLAILRARVNTQLRIAKNHKNNKAFIAVYGLEEFPFERLEIINGELDKEKLNSGKYILEGVSLDDNSNPELEKIHYQMGIR